MHDLASLERACALLERGTRAATTGRILIAGIDRGLRGSADGCDALSALRNEIARRRVPAYESFLSRAPDVEARLAAESGRRSVLHVAPESALHRQFRVVAEEVSLDLGLAAYDCTPEVAEETAAPTDAWRRLLLARRPLLLGDSSLRIQAARPVRAVASTLIRKEAL